MQEQITEIYKIGNIYKRSKILKSWNKRSIVLNFVKGTLSLRNGKNAKEKVILLEDYEIIWVGQPKKSKVFFFTIKAFKNISASKHKRLHIGDVEEANARHWMQEIEKIIDRKYQINQTQPQLLPPLDPIEPSKQPPAQSQQQQPQFIEKNGFLDVPSSNSNRQPKVQNAAVSSSNNNQVNARTSSNNNNNSKTITVATLNINPEMRTPTKVQHQSSLQQLSPMKRSARPVVSVQKGEDYDEILKQFESCCQYNEEESSEYDEHKPFERAVMIPDFNNIYNLQFMPDTIHDNPGIDQIASKAPQAIRHELTAVLEAYYKKGRHFLDYFLAKQSSKQLDTNIFQKKNGDTFIHIPIPNMKPIEVYEEIQTPSTSEHWNHVIQNYQLQPVEHLKTSIRNLSLLRFNFKYEGAASAQVATTPSAKNKNPPIVEKEMAAYRFSVQFASAHFVWEFQQLDRDTDKVIEAKLANKLKNMLLIFPDANNELGCHLIVQSQLSFDNEPPQQQSLNLLRFLNSFQGVKHCADTNNPIQNEIIIECNAEQEDADDEDEIDSQVFISVRIDRTVTSGNAEENMADATVDSILTKLQKNTQIEECIRSKHERRIVSGAYQQVRSTKERGHYCLRHDYKRDEKKGGMVYLNEKLMKEQKTVIMSIVKRIGSNLLNGRSIMNISMPVQIFESRTMIQRLARGFGHAPNFLEKAAQTSSVLEQIKLSAAFLLSSFIMGLSQEKPFNPVIGETVQARLNGCPIYFEQTSHHPAACHYQLYGRGYDMHGCHIPIVNMSANSLQGQVQGGPVINFKNSNTKVMCIWSSFHLYNIIFGQRMLNVTGRAYVFEPKHNLVLELIYNPNSTKGLASIFSKRSIVDEISGALYRVHPHVTAALVAAATPMANKNDLAIDPNKDVIQLISKAEGIWSKYVEFDGIRYWDDDKDFPFVCEYETNPLPSDSRFREDLLYFQKNQKTQSQDQKEIMENAQRHDQKLRDLHKKNKSKQ